MNFEHIRFCFVFIWRSPNLEGLFYLFIYFLYCDLLLLAVAWYFGGAVASVWVRFYFCFDLFKSKFVSGVLLKIF